MNIMVVDDDRIVLAACSRILAANGHVVTLTSSVGEALDLLESERFDLLLLDLIMPGLEGIRLVEVARERRLGLPVLVMSGYPTKENAERAIHAGAAHFVAKPFTPAELIEAIRIVVGDTGSDEEDASGNTTGTGD